MCIMFTGWLTNQEWARNTRRSLLGRGGSKERAQRSVRASQVERGIEQPLQCEPIETGKQHRGKRVWVYRLLWQGLPCNLANASASVSQQLRHPGRQCGITQSEGKQIVACGVPLRLARYALARLIEGDLCEAFSRHMARQRSHLGDVAIRCRAQDGE